MHSEGVSEGMWGYSFFDPGAFDNLANDVLDTPQGQWFALFLVTLQQSICRNATAGFAVLVERIAELFAIVNHPGLVALGVADDNGLVVFIEVAGTQPDQSTLR